MDWVASHSFRCITTTPVASSIGCEFESVADFFLADERRRGDDLHLVRAPDAEYVWLVTWLLRTGEVVAFCVGWTDENAHRWVEVVGPAQEGVNMPRLVQPPGLVRVLGCTLTSDEARNRVARMGGDTLADIAAAFVS